MGDDPIPKHSTLCFAGAKFGVKLRAVLRTTGQSSGTANITVSWKRGDDRCTEVPFNVTGQAVTLDRQLLENCLPGYMSLGTVTYCSDQSKVLLQLVTFLPITITLAEVQCQKGENMPASFRRDVPASTQGGTFPTSNNLPVHESEVLRNDSAPVWECTGETLMPANSTLCFGGSEFGVNLRAVFQTTEAGSGSVNISMSWKRVEAKCPEVSFNSTKWVINLDQGQLDKCLPGFVSLGMLAYCSDQGQLLMQLETPFPIIVTLAKLPCGEEEKDDDDDDEEDEEDEEEEEEEEAEKETKEETESMAVTAQQNASATMASSQQDANVMKKPDVLLP